jgi:DNA mismatch repair protein MutS
MNVHLDATEHGDGIVFLHAVKEGPASRSYGLQVAQLAGVPRDVIGQARLYLEALEAQRDRAAEGNSNGSAQKDLFAAMAPSRAPAARVLEPTPVTDEIRAALEALNPDALSPRAALDALYELRKLLEKRRAQS